MIPVDGDKREREELMAARDDPARFTLIFDRYIEPVYRFCLLRLGSREQAEDAASQTFLKALAQLDGYRGGSVRGWLFAIARTTVVDLQRRSALESRHHMRADPADASISPEARFIAQEEVRWLYAALDALTADQREVVALRLAGLGAIEIAEATGRTPGSVRALQFRAVREMKRLHATGELREEA